MATIPTRPEPDAGAAVDATDTGVASAAPLPAAGETSALSSTDKIVELADYLSACADQLHERVLKEIRSHGGKPVPEHIQDKARALLDDETLLRQRANGLYADAATHIVKGVGKPQAHLVKLTADAAEKIRKIGVIGEVTGLVGGLLTLAGAAATGQPVAILAAIEKVEKHGKALNALKPKPPAKAG